MALSPIVTAITRNTPDLYYDIGLESNDAIIIVNTNPNTYGEQQSRELPSILFELYVEDTSNGMVLLDDMSKTWSINSSESIILHRVPSDIKMKIIPLFDEDYIKSLDESERTQSFDISVYVDTNYGSNGGGGGGSSYTLPPATESTLGGIKVGSNLTITDDGTLSAISGTSIRFNLVSSNGSISIDSSVTVEEFESIMENVENGTDIMPYISVWYEDTQINVGTFMQATTIRKGTPPYRIICVSKTESTDVTLKISYEGNIWTVA